MSRFTSSYAKFVGGGFPLAVLRHRWPLHWNTGEPPYMLSVRNVQTNVWYKSQLGIFKMSGRECVRSPCSKGWPLTAVAFILRASLADVSQCEPLLVSWSLSAWSLSPWPLSRRLARSASLNVELQQNGRKKKKRRKKSQLTITSTLTPWERSYLIAIVSWLDTKMKELNARVRKPFE